MTGRVGDSYKQTSIDRRLGTLDILKMNFYSCTEVVINHKDVYEIYMREINW